jgi:glucose dehydrogenase
MFGLKTAPTVADRCKLVSTIYDYISGDAGGTKYSPLDQMNASDVSNLKIAWRWKSENYGARGNRE